MRAPQSAQLVVSSLKPRRRATTGLILTANLQSGGRGARNFFRADQRFVDVGPQAGSKGHGGLVSSNRNGRLQERAAEKLRCIERGGMFETKSTAQKQSRSE